MTASATVETSAEVPAPRRLAVESEALLAGAVAAGATGLVALFRGQLGSIELRRGRAAEALAIYDEVLVDVRRDGDRFVEMIELTNSGWARLALGEARPELFARHLELALRLGNEDGVQNALEGIAACAILLGDIDRAGVLLGAVDVLWTRTGRVDQRTYPTSGPIVERVLASDRAIELEAGRSRGRAISRRAALRIARDYAGVRAVEPA